MHVYQIGEPQLSWWMPRIEERGPAIAIEGAIVATEWPAPDTLRLAVDGRVGPGLDYLTAPASKAVQFRGLLHVASHFGDRDEIVLRVVHAGTGAFARTGDEFALARPGRKSDIPLPPAKLTERAIWVGPRTFDKWGYALKRKLDAAFEPYLRRPRTALRLLDWGCGAGRLARYLAHEFQYTGIDIDREAIAWCRQSIGFGAFELQSLRAQTVFETDSFDVAIGISIFTHLREEEQFAWLKELRRVVRGDGIVAVSVNGATSLFNAGDPPEVLRTLQARGFCDTGAEPTLKGVTADDTYYRNIYHTHDYIREAWSREFEILDILPAFVGNMQDLVLMRPRR